MADTVLFVVLFFAAYMAEVLRGGLQAIPRGQLEATTALGITYWTAMRKAKIAEDAEEDEHERNAEERMAGLV